MAAVSSNESGLYDIVGGDFYKNKGNSTLYSGYVISDTLVGINRDHTLYAIWTR